VLTEVADRARFWEYVPAPYWFFDLGMASLLILLTSVDEGLDSCFVGIHA